MKLFYQKLGTGQPLIILHGLYGFSDNWLSIGRILSTNFSVYLIDQRNHGRSPHHPVQNYRAMADDLYTFMQEEKIQSAIILGHSMGGKTAMLFSALHSELVSGLIIVDIGPGGYVSIDSPSPQSLIHLNIVNMLLSLNPGNFSSRIEIEREMAKSIEDPAIRQFLMKNVHRKHDNTFSWKLNVDAIAKGLPEIMGSIALEKVLGGEPVLGFPVLFIKGEFSGYINSEQEELIKRFFPKAQIKTVLGAGHWVHADQPDKFMETLHAFLQTYF